MRQQVLIGVERRRRWSDEQKLKVLSEIGIEGASVAEVPAGTTSPGSTSINGAQRDASQV